MTLQNHRESLENTHKFVMDYILTPSKGVSTKGRLRVSDFESIYNKLNIWLHEKQFHIEPEKELQLYFFLLIYTFILLVEPSDRQRLAKFYNDPFKMIESLKFILEVRDKIKDIQSTFKSSDRISKFGTAIYGALDETLRIIDVEYEDEKQFADSSHYERATDTLTFRTYSGIVFANLQEFAGVEDIKQRKKILKQLCILFDYMGIASAETENSRTQINNKIDKALKSIGKKGK